MQSECAQQDTCCEMPSSGACLLTPDLRHPVLTSLACSVTKGKLRLSKMLLQRGHGRSCTTDYSGACVAPHAQILSDWQYCVCRCLDAVTLDAKTPVSGSISVSMVGIEESAHM